MSETDLGFRSGFVAVVGRPNVGKSTLVNALVGEKVAITSNKPQTTRSTIRGILEVAGAQIVFLDTPGYHKPRNLLGERLNEAVRAAWSDVDLTLFVVDGASGVGGGDRLMAQELAQTTSDVFCVLNKIDAMPKGKIAQQLTAAAELSDFAEYIPTSARDGEGLDVLKELVVGRMPHGPQYYPAGSRSDQPPPRFVAELVREKLLSRTYDEVPHSIAVVTDDYEERDDGLLTIRASIYVERESQKGIVVGKGGETIKAVGTEARYEIETLFGRKVFLDLRAKVERDWQRHAHALERLGFTT
ncbi:MAG: GTPase Era [Actinomycetota bacterium]|nr:GTPase Era [Actinomycetota bacterium]